MTQLYSIWMQLDDIKVNSNFKRLVAIRLGMANQTLTHLMHLNGTSMMLTQP